MSKLLAPLLKEPAVVLGAVCGACVFLLTRYLSIDNSTAHQIVYAVVPFLFAGITRQFVTPNTKAPAVTTSKFVAMTAPSNVNATPVTTTEPAPPVL